MKNSFINIFAIIIIGLLSSCIQREFYETHGPDQEGTVLFSAKPTGYIPTTVGTKAGETSTFDYETFENTVYNAYFMLVDKDEILRIKEPANVENNSTVSFSVERDVLNVFPNSRVCFLANIPAKELNRFTVGTTTWSDIESFYLNVDYAPVNETKCIGVPAKSDLNADGISEYGLPMFGSQVMNSSNSNATFQIERLLARVEIYVSLGIEDNEEFSTLLSEPQFGMDACEIHNIPNFIPLTEKDVTKYSDIQDDAIALQQLTKETYNTYNLDLGENKMLYYSDPESVVYKSLYFYTPEHKLGELGSNSDPAKKPDLLKGTTKRPVYASISGYLVDGDGASYNAKYNIYLGGNPTNNFDLERNKIYKNFIRINGVENGPDVDHRVEVLDKMKEIVDDVTKSGQSANCYIINTVGTYMLPAYRGAGDLADAEMCDVGENVVIACDNANISITINEELSKQSTIVFTVALKNTGLLSGNAVIARVVNNSIDWSWHLWFIPGIKVGNGDSDLGNMLRIGGLQDENMYDGTPMANRNVGVTAAVEDFDTYLQGTQLGLYYRYGYRNPYFEDKVYGNGTYYHGLEEDDEPQLWESASAKSATDPCPPGYRVPPKSVWKDPNAANATNGHYKVHLDWLGIDTEAFVYWNRGTSGTTQVFDDIYYPYTVLGSAGNDNYHELGLDYEFTEQSDAKTIREWTESRRSYREREYVETSYSNFKYKVATSAYFEGELATQSSEEILQYKNLTYTKSDIEDRSVFISCTKTENKVVQKQRKALLGSSWINEGSPSRTQLSSEPITTEPSIDWRSRASYDQFGLLNLTGPKSVGENTFAPLDNIKGYQVRCMKEPTPAAQTE